MGRHDKAKVAVCFIATGPYNDFIPDRIKEIRQLFLVNHEVHFHLISDRQWEESDTFKVYPVKHTKWIDICHRKHQLLLQVPMLEYDYVFYLDADLQVLKPVGDEALSELVAQRHHMWVDWEPVTLPFERYHLSKACVRDNDGRMYIGQLMGGSGKRFHEVCALISEQVEADISIGFRPIFFDESYWNAYLQKHRPTFEFPHNSSGWNPVKDSYIFLSVDKDHVGLRKL